jgi:hypothetical protein
VEGVIRVLGDGWGAGDGRGADWTLLPFKLPYMLDTLAYWTFPPYIKGWGWK